MLLGGCHVYDWMDSIQITVHGMERGWKGGDGVKLSYIPIFRNINSDYVFIEQFIPFNLLKRNW